MNEPYTLLLDTLNNALYDVFNYIAVVSIRLVVSEAHHAPM